MKIKQILQGKIDDWTPEFECTVKEIKETKARTKANRQMSKCIVYDDEEKTGCWIYTDECMVKVGQKLILTGMLKTYNNNFYIDFCKVSRVLAQSTPQNPSQQAPQPQQAKNPSVSTIVAPDSKNASICRQTAGKVVAQILSTHGFNSVKDMYNIILEVAVPLAKWFETGELPKVEEDPADERANSHGTYVTEIMPDSSITEEEESLPF